MEIMVAIGDRTFVIESLRSIEIGKAAQSVDVDLADWPEASILYAIDYGLKQSLNDAAAPVKAGEPAENVMAMVNKRLDNLRAGTVRATGGRIGDSVRATAVKIAAKYAPKGLDPKAKRAWAIAQVEKNPQYTMLAQKKVDHDRALIVDFDPAA